MLATARLISPANLAAAPALRSQYQSKAAANSSLAASWNSTSLFVVRERRGDSAANFFPGNRLCPSRVQIRNAPRDLLLPGAFRALIDCCVQAVNQRARQIRAFFLGQAQRLLHYLGGSFGHGLSIPRLSVSSITSSFASRTKITSPRPGTGAKATKRPPWSSTSPANQTTLLMPRGRKLPVGPRVSPGFHVLKA